MPWKVERIGNPFATELRSDTVRPIREGIAAGLEAAWQAGLEKEIDRLLGEIAGW